MQIDAEFATIFVTIRKSLSFLCWFAWDSFSSRVYDHESGEFLFEVVSGHPSSDIRTSVSKGLSMEECYQDMETQKKEIQMRNEQRAREQGPESVLDVHLSCNAIRM